MAQIEGLREQQEALKRITHNMKEIQDINTFLAQVHAMSLDKNAAPEYSILISFAVGSDIKRFKTSMLVPDNQYIFEAVQKHKETIVAKVRRDAAEFRIRLSDKESEALDWELPTE